MTTFPFFLDRSPTAKLIRAIGQPNCEGNNLDALLTLMRHTSDKLSYGTSDQILRRAERAQTHVCNQSNLEKLEALKRLSLWRIQRIHLESRP